jgi:hypothetical protein
VCGPAQTSNEVNCRCVGRDLEIAATVIRN